MRDRLGLTVAIQLPGSETTSGVVAACIYNNDQGTDIEETDIPAEIQEMAQEHRAKLRRWQRQMKRVERLEGELTEAEIQRSAPGTIVGTIVPVLCSTFKNKGVQLMLDAVVDYLHQLMCHRFREHCRPARLFASRQR